MATRPSDAHGNQHGTTPTNNGIRAAVKTQLSLVSSFEKWLDTRTEVDGDRNSIIAKIQRRLDTYKHWLLRVDATPTSVTKDTEPWTMDARAESGDEKRVVVRVTGPGSGEAVEITAADREEVEYLLSVCRLPRASNLSSYH